MSLRDVAQQADVSRSAPELLAIGFAVALLSSAIPYSLELERCGGFRPGRSAC